MNNYFVFENVHPQGKLVGDCVKRAITKATGMQYDEVKRQLNRYKKISGADKFNEKKNCYAYVENILHGIKISFPAKAGHCRMNGERFCQQYPKGSYILSMAGHWSCCVNGKIYDTWDCTEKCVYQAWKLS